MAFVSIATADIAAGKPVDNDLMTQLKDNFDSLQGDIGASANVGLVGNGSFEVDSDSDNIPDGWTFTAYPGGVGTITTTGDSHGANCFSMVHPGGASNGGGYLESDYIECSEYLEQVISFILSDTASAKNIVEVRHFTDAKVYISTTTAYSATTATTTPTWFDYIFTPPATARFLKIRLIGGYTDTDSAGTTYFGFVSLRMAVAQSAVGQAQLKTATGSVSTTSTSGVALTLPGGEYGFFPQIYNAGGDLTTVMGNGVWVKTGTTPTSIIGLKTSAGTGYAKQRYIQSSPPYKIGDVGWGHFLFVLRNISTGEVIGSYEAQDPPWAYNGPPNNPKDSQERVVSVPHPFADYYDKDPSADGLEICLIDLREFDEQAWRAAPANRDKSSIIHDFKTVAPVGKVKSRAEIGLPEITGFTDKVVFRSRT